MTSSPRLTKLDGIRGLLSLVVALNHSFLVVAIPAFANVWGQNYLRYFDLQSKLQQIFMLLGNGGAAVSMFFILSGLVLGQSLSRVEISVKGLLAFYIKRFLRLYPVYLFLIIITAAYMRLGYVHLEFPHASSWFTWWMNFQMTFREFVYNLLFVHTYLGGVTWTLRVILLASLIFPAFYLLTKKTSWLVDLCLVGLLIFLSFTILNITGFRDLRYLYMFFLGLCLPKFSRFFSAVPGWVTALYLPLGIILLMTVRYSTDEYFGGVIESLVSWGFIGLIVYSEKTQLFNILNHHILQFFGKISYSLYLIHFSVLYVLGRLMFQLLPGLPYAENYLAIHLALFVLSLPLATAVSVLVYKFIEVPSVHLSSSAAHLIQKS